MILPVILLSASVLIAVFNKKLGYIAIAFSAIVFAAISVLSFSLLHAFWLVASISWAMISLYSLSYDKYGKWLSALLSIMIAGMSLVLTANNFILFLAGWEIMSISSYFILGLNKSNESPPFLFMAFSEISTMMILLGFSLAYSETGSLAFVHLSSSLPLDLTVMGFLIKMGSFPFLLVEWLPAAHGEAPANASAALSGTMTLMGAYGIVKMIGISPADVQLGLLLLGTGAFTAFFGALYAHTTDHYKKLPAYSTIENNGSILVLFGAALLSPNLTIKYFALVGALLFGMAHTFGKTGLFMISGLVDGESLSQSNGPRSLTIDAGKALLTSSLSGLLPSLGGVATWMLLEITFMLAYVERYTLLGVVFIISGIVIAIAEGMATSVMIKFFAFSGAFSLSIKKSNAWAFLMGIIVLLSGLTASVIVGAIDSSYIGSAPSLYNYFIIFSLKSSTSTFGGIDPLYIGILIGAFSLLTVAIFGRPKARRAPVWNNGEAQGEKYTSTAFSHNIILMLKIFYRPTHYNITKNVFWQFLYFITRAYKKLTKAVTYYVMNSSISTYMLYMIMLLIFIIIIVSL
ncbi:MAG: hydrogenase 4 subunit B [Nitrososphaerota archaeon]|jgi:formate hydrogenlyase subunit 3/multisubunit Na+/H+ antiporter MnhD subunit|nr:hydrogenase 4 subunit B [Nitrososphaerota archaeon]MDG6927272.1 hydrogenase 4 subunit B [Nitrososphaerota archaeon]MDG6930370.1 hydrogenase 4 subunit B [Nitrososphaerota archaeon]MDG6931726.1 hydrogenase 4 subunit B [Nitrososphaerota archaeon]MDG6936774.1 hydrogenase 4 subunit B [Nitrososphaerota archaeon]